MRTSSGLVVLLCCCAHVAHAEPSVDDAGAGAETESATDPESEISKPEAETTVEPAPTADPASAPAVTLKPPAAATLKPPVSALRVAGEVLGAGLVGLGGLMVGAAVGEKYECRDGCGGEDPGLAGTLIGGGIGMILAMPLGVYAFGSIGDQSGSLGYTYAGGLAGLGLAAMVAPLLVQPGIGAAELTPLVGVFTVPIGAIVGFNLSRRYDARAARALTFVPNISSNRVTLAFGGRF